MIKDFEEAGFVEVKVWYQPNYMQIRNGEEYWALQKGMPSNVELFKKIDEEVENKVKNEVIDTFNQKCGSGVHDPNTFEVMVIIA
jgi:hypothetical protein